MRVTMCIAGAAASERAHKEMAFVHTKSRNRLQDTRMNDMVYIRMNLQLLEDQRIDNWGCTEVFNLNEGSDDEAENIDDNFGTVDAAWLDAAEDALPTNLERDIEQSQRRHRKVGAKANATQIGWTIDVNEGAESTSRRTGRVSRLPMRLRPEVYGWGEMEEDEEDEED